MFEFICFARIYPSCISKKERKLNRKSRTKAVKNWTSMNWKFSMRFYLRFLEFVVFLPLCDACWSWISLAIDFLTARHFCDLFATDKKINLTRCLDTLITKCLSVTVDNNFWQVLQATIKCGCAIKVDENAVLSFMTWKLW